MKRDLKLPVDFDAPIADDALGCNVNEPFYLRSKGTRCTRHEKER